MRGGRYEGMGCRERSDAPDTPTAEGWRTEHNARPDNRPHKSGTAEAKVGRYVYDARGNGDGKTASSIVGDHQNRITDYTTIALIRKVKNER